MAKYRDLDWEIDRELGRISEEEALGIQQPKLRRLLRWAAKSRIWKYAAWPLKIVWKVATVPVVFNLPVARRIASVPREGKAPWWVSLIDGLLTRVLLAPILTLGFFGVLVWWTTHPAVALASQTPAQFNVYYKQVDLATQDKQWVDLWYLPPIRVDDVVRNSDEALSEKRPGVVLCHGLGHTTDEYLPLALKLNQQGYAVALLNTRGQTATGGGAVTFGLREGLDVLAAVSYLRDYPYVDPNRIAVVGSGIGGSAVLHAAALDHSIAAVAAENVWPTLEAFVSHSLRQRYVPAPLMTTLYVATFETLLRERSADGDLQQVMPQISQPALLLARTTPDAAPAADVVRLSALTNGQHQAVVIDSAATGPSGDTDAVNDTISTFLNKSLKWTPPENRMSAKVQKLLDAQVK